MYLYSPLHVICLPLIVSFCMSLTFSPIKNNSLTRFNYVSYIFHMPFPEYIYSGCISVLDMFRPVCCIAGTRYLQAFLIYILFFFLADQMFLANTDFSSSGLELFFFKRLRWFSKMFWVQNAFHCISSCTLWQSWPSPCPALYTAELSWGDVTL